MIARIRAWLTTQAAPDAGTRFRAPPRVPSTARRRQRLIADGRALLVEAEALKGELDGLAEMGEIESLRLQMAMDRMAKMMATLSNLLKTISETQQAIIQNIK